MEQENKWCSKISNDKVTRVTFNKTCLNLINMLTTPQITYEIQLLASLNYELSIQDISFSFIAHCMYKSLMPQSCDWHL